MLFFFLFGVVGGKILWKYENLGSIKGVNLLNFDFRFNKFKIILDSNNLIIKLLIYFKSLIKCRRGIALFLKIHAKEMFYFVDLRN